MKNWKEGFKRSEQGTMVEYLPGGAEISNIRSTMNSTVVSISEQVASTTTWKASEAVTSYNVYSAKGNYNKYMNMRRVSLNEGINSPSTITKKATLGSVEVKGTVYDEVTSVLTELEIYAGDVMGKQMADAFKKGIQYGIKRKYNNRNDGTWDQNSLPWKTYKSRNNYSTKPMHMRDTNKWPGLGTVPESIPLSDTMANFGNSIIIVQTGPNNYEIHGIDEEFAGTPHVWFHENGYDVKGMFKGSVVPPRPFIAPGINEAMAYASGLVMNKNPITSPKKKAITYELGSVGQYEIQRKKSMQDFFMYLWWFMPQISEYQYLAYVHDAVGYMSGHFITGETIKHFAKSLVAGKVGVMTGVPMTTKLARRTSRKALWGADTISIMGSG